MLDSKSRQSGWLLFVLTLQGHQPAVRMRVWRSLKALGTAVLRDGVYILPHRDEFLEILQVQADEVTASKGSAQILEVAARDESQEVEFRQLFDRTSAYEDLLQKVRKLSKTIGRTPDASLSTALTKVWREFEALVHQDFFPGAAREQTRDALESLTTRAKTVLSPDEPQAMPGQIEAKDRAKYQGRTWATRARPWADRLASAWLIKCFIDPRAKFLWLKSPRDCPKRAVGYDFDGAEFTHVGAKVTFEVLLAAFGLDDDPALERIGALIHFLDTGGVPVPEAAGVEAMLRGAGQLMADDDSLMTEAARIFQFLYAHYSESN